MGAYSHWGTAMYSSDGMQAVGARDCVVAGGQRCAAGWGGLRHMLAGPDAAGQMHESAAAAQAVLVALAGLSKCVSR